MSRALILGGTGAIGVATALRLRRAGWSVTVTGRDPARVPPVLADVGVAVVTSASAGRPGLPALLGSGADLLVDAACYDVADARAVAAVLDDVSSAVMISSKAVYVDAAGRHSNSADPPQFDGPICETQATLAGDARRLDEGAPYGAAKVAAEEVLLDSGAPVTILRPSKVHGAWSRRPREWVFVRRVLDGRTAVVLRRGGMGAEHPSAAANLAALVEVVAARPGARVLNAADPDCPTGGEMARVVASALGHTFVEVDADPARDPGLGRHPWDRVPPVVLDLQRARALGYAPVGDYAATVIEELSWLVDEARGATGSPWLPAADDAFFAPFFDYAREDAFLASCATRSGERGVPD